MPTAKKQTKGVPPPSAGKAAKPKKPHGLAGKGGKKNHAANAAAYKQIQEDVRAVLSVPMERYPCGAVKVIDWAKKPKVYDQELGRRICLMFETDPRMSLVRINTDPTLPLVSTFYEWLESHPDLNRDYIRAREVHSDLQAEELATITREPLRGEVRVTKTGVDAEGQAFSSEEVRVIDNVDRARLIVDTDKWILSKLRPKKYGVAPMEIEGNQPLKDLLAEFRARSKELEDGE